MVVGKTRVHERLEQRGKIAVPLEQAEPEEIDLVVQEVSSGQQEDPVFLLKRSTAAGQPWNARITVERPRTRNEVQADPGELRLDGNPRRIEIRRLEGIGFERRGEQGLHRRRRRGEQRRLHPL